MDLKNNFPPETNLELIKQSRDNTQAFASNSTDKILLKGQVYSNKQIVIAPFLIGANGQESELFFTRDSCMKIAKQIRIHFQFKQGFSRISEDHKKYHIELPQKILLELDEL